MAARGLSLWFPNGWALTPLHSPCLRADVNTGWRVMLYSYPSVPYPENSELKIKTLAGISLYLEMLSLQGLAELPRLSHSSQWDGEMAHLILLCGMEISRAAHFVRLSITRHPDWDEESCYIQLPITAPMELCGSISVWKYFSFQTLGGRVWDGKSLLKNWYCSQKTDT